MSLIRIGTVACSIALLGAGCISKPKTSSTGQISQPSPTPIIQQTTVTQPNTTTVPVPATTLLVQPVSTTTAPATTAIANPTLKRQIAFYAILTKKISEAISGCLATLDAVSAESSNTDCLRVLAYNEFATRLAAEPPLVRIRTAISAAASAVDNAIVEQNSFFTLKFDTTIFRTALKQYSEKIMPIIRSIEDLKKTYAISEQFEQALRTDVLDKLSGGNKKGGFGVVASCGEDNTCFDQKFVLCQKATLTVNLGEKGTAYTILAPTRDGLCSVRISEVLPPIEFLAPHTMICSLVTSANFLEEMNRTMVEMQKNPNQIACRGSMVADVAAAAKLFVSPDNP